MIRDISINTTGQILGELAIKKIGLLELNMQSEEERFKTIETNKNYSQIVDSEDQAEISKTLRQKSLLVKETIKFLNIFVKYLDPLAFYSVSYNDLDFLENPSRIDYREIL